MNKQQFDFRRVNYIKPYTNHIQTLTIVMMKSDYYSLSSSIIDVIDPSATKSSEKKIDYAKKVNPSLPQWRVSSTITATSQFW